MRRPPPSRRAPQPPGAAGTPLVPGDRIGAYRLLSVLGEGGFGVVYRAEQERPVRRTVALKVIRLGMETPEVIARFEAERQALALMSHPSIARIFDAGLTESGRPYFAMEYIEGVPITDHCAARALGIRERLELFIPVCEAVGHAHQKAVIHRDIKPSNVLVTVASGAPLPKIIDFGVAKATGGRLTDLTLHTQAGQLLGTPAYMSPEQVDATGVDIDTRTDIYSLGVLLYELLTGSLPFDPAALRRSSLAEIERAIREDDPVLPSARAAPEFARRIRGDLDWIVMKAMAKDRGRRYQSAGELADDIRRHLDHQPVLAGPPGLGYRLRKLLRRHRGAAALSSAALVAAALVAGAFELRAAAAYRRAIATAGAALEARDLDAARAAVAVLLDRHADRSAVRELARDLELLEASLLSERSALSLEAALQSWKKSRAKWGEAVELERAWKETRARPPVWALPWQRGEEFDISERLAAARRESEAFNDEAMLEFQRSLDLAPADSAAERAARTAFAEAFRVLYDQALADGNVTVRPESFMRRGSALDGATFARRGGSIAISLDPPDAEVHCFRYEEHEKRLVPLPFDARAAEAGARREGRPPPEPHLEIESARSDVPFRPGDHLLSAGGRPLRIWSDLAKALASAAKDAPTEVEVKRASTGLVETVAWIPFPAALYPAADDSPFKPGVLVSAREQFGFNLCAFPLEFAGDSRIPRDPGASSLTFHLPDGSYLFVARRTGFAEARYPVNVASKDVSVRLRLIPEADIPPGFIRIPAGPTTCGGDPEAFQSLPLEDVEVADFFIARLEVTFGEYLEFLNAPLHPIDDGGEAPPATPEVTAYLRKYPSKPGGEPRVDLVPRWDSDTSCVVRERPGGRWTLTKEIKSPRWPVFGVSQLAAREYAHWLTEKKGGGRWRFRLPTDREWEKAARGADRRAFVWGSYPLWSYAWIHRGIYLKTKRPEEVGISPADESVYGVRDLGGSVSEHATGLPSLPFRFESLRGGNWLNTDEYYGRVATRNGLIPENSAKSTGFRLVAEPAGR